MHPLGFGDEGLLPYLPFAVAVTAAIAALWLRRRGRFVRFFGMRGGRIHGRFRVACYSGIVVLISGGLWLLICEPYVKTATPAEVFESLQIVLAVDISRSMLAPASGAFQRAAGGGAGPQCDPSRLESAAREVNSFIEVLRQKGLDRIALVIFARYAYPAIPVLTDDYRLFRRRFEKEMSPGNVLSMTEGTNHWYAVEQSLPVFDPRDPSRKVLVILTDGEPSAPEDAIVKSRIEALALLRDTDNIEIYVVGIGEPGIRVPVPAALGEDGCPDREEGFLLQTGGPDKGRVMTTVTDTSSLRLLADELGGEYIHSRTGADLSGKLRQIVDKERSKIGVVYKEAYKDLSEHLILTLLALQAILGALRTP